MPDPALLLAFECIDQKEITRNAINKILLTNDLNLAKLEGVIDEIVDTKRPIVIFGTGNYARSIMINTNISKAQIVCFVDNDKSIQDTIFFGYSINPPEFLKEIEADILILSMLGHEQIKNQIHDMEISNKIIVL